MEKSKGHICFQERQHSSAPWEWIDFRGEVYRAPSDRPLDRDGFRMGSRWECSRVQFDRCRSFLIPGDTISIGRLRRES